MNFKKLTIIIPTLNEGGSIGELLGKIKVLYPLAKIIVSDDGSTDNTHEIVRKFKGTYLLNRKNKKVKGLTASVIDAVKIVKTPYIVVMDGDMQHPPEKVGDIAKKLINYKIVVGTRKKIIGDWGFFRKIMSKTAIILGKIRLGSKVRCDDVVSGFFGIRTTLFKYFINNHESSFEGGGYKILFDILKMVKMGTKIGSIKYNFMIREKDQSKMGKRHVLFYFKSLLK